MTEDKIVKYQVSLFHYLRLLTSYDQWSIHWNDETAKHILRGKLGN